MNDSVDPPSPPRVAPTLKLSRGCLVGSLLAMVAAGLGVYAIFPDSVGGPSLPVSVAIDRQPVTTASGQGAMLTDVLVVTNLADHEIRRLAVEVNGQYLLFCDSPLKEKQELILPLRIFTDKRSSQRYNPTKYPPEEVIVRGQLPGGARGTTKFHLND